MTTRDPAADAHTIAALHISELAWFAAEEIEEQLGWMPGGVPDLTDTEITAIRAELAALADRLTLALGPGARIVWGWTADARPGEEYGYRTRADAADAARLAGYPDAAIVCRLTTAWQPAPVPACSCWASPETAEGPQPDCPTHGGQLAPTTAEVWDDSTPPGGYVCAAPDPTRPGDICGMPTESEPCPIHAPSTED